MSSSLIRVVEEAAADVWPDAQAPRLTIRHTARQVAVAWVWTTADDGSDRILAAAGGADSGEALRALLTVIYRNDHNLTTYEAATILGTKRGAVQMAGDRGLLPRTQRGAGPRASTYTPADVLIRAGLPIRT